MNNIITLSNADWWQIMPTSNEQFWALQLPDTLDMMLSLNKSDWACVQSVLSSTSSPQSNKRRSKVVIQSGFYPYTWWVQFAPNEKYGKEFC